MTDKLPLLADGLVDGGLAPEFAPEELRAAINVLRAASQRGSAAELADSGIRVQQFCAELKATRVSAPTATQIHSFTSAPAHDATRSTPMFATRITRKAMTIFAITLLAAGTAAAAGGALPMFEEEPTEAVVESPNDVVEEDADTDTETETGTGTGTGTDEQTGDDEAAAGGAVPTVVENNNGDVDHYGKCTAWTSGSAKDASNSSFVELQSAADAAQVTIDEYCVTVLGTTKSEDKKSEDKKSEDKKSEDKKSEDKKSEDKKSEDKKSEDKKSEDKKSEDKKSEEVESEEVESDDDEASSVESDKDEGKGRGKGKGKDKGKD